MIIKTKVYWEIEGNLSPEQIDDIAGGLSSYIEDCLKNERKWSESDIDKETYRFRLITQTKVREIMIGKKPDFSTARKSRPKKT